MYMLIFAKVILDSNTNNNTWHIFVQYVVITYNYKSSTINSTQFI